MINHLEKMPRSHSGTPGGEHAERRKVGRKQRSERPRKTPGVSRVREMALHVILPKLVLIELGLYPKYFVPYLEGTATLFSSLKLNLT